MNFLILSQHKLNLRLNHDVETVQLGENVLLIKTDQSLIPQLLQDIDQSLVSVWPITVFDRHKRLIVFDMDSTLIQQEVIDELALEAGVVDQVKEITHRAMNGECDFKESLRMRVSLLQGAPVKILLNVRDRITFSPGARELTRILRSLGVIMAVVSGGFLPLAQYVKSQLGLDYAFANQLEVTPDGKYFTGKTIGTIIDGEKKADILMTLMQAHSLCRDQVMAVGDGANDLLMMKASGLGIAYNAKPKVQNEATCRINVPSLLSVLYFMGFSHDQISELEIKTRPKIDLCL